MILRVIAFITIEHVCLYNLMLESLGCCSVELFTEIAKSHCSIPTYSLISWDRRLRYRGGVWAGGTSPTEEWWRAFCIVCCLTFIFHSIIFSRITVLTFWRALFLVVLLFKTFWYLVWLPSIFPLWYFYYTHFVCLHTLALGNRVYDSCSYHSSVTTSTKSHVGVEGSTSGIRAVRFWVKPHVI